MGCYRFETIMFSLTYAWITRDRLLSRSAQSSHHEPSLVIEN